MLQFLLTHFQIPGWKPQVILLIFRALNIISPGMFHDNCHNLSAIGKIN